VAAVDNLIRKIVKVQVKWKTQLCGAIWFQFLIQLEATGWWKVHKNKRKALKLCRA
jgi:hypothetical protein